MQFFTVTFLEFCIAIWVGSLPEPVAVILNPAQLKVMLAVLFIRMQAVPEFPPPLYVSEAAPLTLPVSVTVPGVLISWQVFAE
jgi:hypothetical protein